MACLLIATNLPSTEAATLTWIGGNVDWIDAGSTANWSPADEPDSNDEALFNTANAVNLGSNNAVNGLTMSGGIDLLTNDFDLTIDGLVSVGGAGTNLFIGGAASSIVADNVTINASGTIEMRGGRLDLDEEVGTSLLDINAGGLLQGNGIVDFQDLPGVPTLLLRNDGTLTALSRGLTIFSPPPVGTLTITDSNNNGRIDLDGAAETGVVNVNRNQTLATDIFPQDTFNGTLNLSHNSKFDFNPTFTLGAGGTITANNGFVAGGLGFSDIPADTSFIDTVELVQSGGTINVADTDGTLQIDAPFTMSGGSFTNFGTAIFNGITSITTAAGYDPSAVNSQTIVNANLTINDAAGNFNWDGNGAADTTVNNGSFLSITANQIDTGDNTFGGTITLNGGSDLTVNVAATSWTLGGSLVKNNAGTSTVSGDRVIVTGTVTGNAGILDLPPVTTSLAANVAATGTVTFGSASELSGGSLSGAGLLRMEGTSTVLSNTTIGVATFDWDGLGTGTTHTINSGVVFTINSAAMDTDGDMDDPLVLAGNGTNLVVNDANGLTQWTMNGVMTGNASGVGIASISGTSRMILANVINVDGNTDINALVTFNRAGLVADIDAGKILDVNSSGTAYAAGTIDGAGTFDPGVSNTVTGDFTINSDLFDFDGGSWIVESGSTLTFNSAVDYEPDSVTNSFESTITLNNGGIFANVADASLVMNGTMNMNASGGFLAAEWQGDAIDIGNDAGILDANLNVTGDGNPNSQARFFAPVTFQSDADVDVPAGATLVLNRVVNFNTVNAANNAEFTGAGTMIFSDDVNVNEAVTLNMVGGTVDLDGVDAVGDFVNIDAPFTINAATMTNFGRVNGGGGINTLDVNNSVGTGVLTVNLDDPAAEWTLNGPGVMNLVNDNAAATLLAGNDVNVNGTLNVTGDARTTARLDIAGVVNINTAAEPLHLSGGSLAVPNTLAGGTISGSGILSADNGRALHGSGTINTSIDFDGTANLLADNGVLTLNGAIVDVNLIGTDDDDAILHVTNAWNNSVAFALTIRGGEVRGGTITNDASGGILGDGLLSARVINNTRLAAGNDLHLVVQTVGNDNDWDGLANTGTLEANFNRTLEIRDTGVPFGFGGTVNASSGGRVFANGFALDFNPGSAINLTGSTYESTSSTDIGGTVTIGAGSDSRIKVTNNFFLTFETGSSTTLNANLELQNNNIIVEAGATFAGVGALRIAPGSHAVAQPNADINVLLYNQGNFRPCNSEAVGRVDLRDYQQTANANLFMEIQGNALNQFDRLVIDGAAVLNGFLDLDVDAGFVPTAGQTFDIITATGGVSGKFIGFTTQSLPEGLVFDVSYLATSVRVTVKAGNHYDAWIAKFPSLTDPADRLRTADPDDDGLSNLAEFAFNDDPTKGLGATKFFEKVVSSGGEHVLTLTLPMRYLTVKFPPAQPVGELILEELEDGMNYIVQGSDSLTAYPLEVTEITGSSALALQAGLPAVDSEWTYRSFRTTSVAGGSGRRFMRVQVTE